MKHDHDEDQFQYLSASLETKDYPTTSNSPKVMQFICKYRKGFKLHTINAAERKNAAPLILESAYSS